MKHYKHHLCIIAGIVFILIGFIFMSNSYDLYETFPYVFIGLGIGVLAYGTGEFFYNKLKLHKNDYVEIVEIEREDERNLSIIEKANAKAFQLMIYVFAVLIILFAIVNVNKYITLSLTVVYVTIFLSKFYFIYKLQHKM